MKMRCLQIYEHYYIIMLSYLSTCSMIEYYRLNETLNPTITFSQTYGKPLNSIFNLENAINLQIGHQLTILSFLIYSTKPLENNVRNSFFFCYSNFLQIFASVNMIQNSYMHVIP